MDDFGMETRKLREKVHFSAFSAVSNRTSNFSDSAVYSSIIYENTHCVNRVLQCRLMCEPAV